MLKNTILTLLCLTAFMISVLAADVAVLVEKQLITEGESVRTTILRGDMEGNLTVNYTIGAPKLPLKNIVASSNSNASLATLIDERLDTCWLNNGHSQQNPIKDDEPFLIFYLNEPTAVESISLANYVNPWHEMRCVNDAVIEISKDGVNFEEAMQIKCARQMGTYTSSLQKFVLPPQLQKEAILAIKLKVLSNYNREFYKGTSFEGPYPHVSMVGLAEVAIHGRGISPDTLAYNNLSVTIPDGESSVSFNVNTKDDPYIYGDRVLEIKLSQSENYTLKDGGFAQVLVKDNDFGPEVSLITSKPLADFAAGEVGEFTFKRNSTQGETVIRYTTANEFLPVSMIAASSTFQGSNANLIDNNLATNWMNGGNASNEGEEDDEPWVVFTFDDIYPVGMMKIANHVQLGHTFRCIKNFEVLAAQNENDFISLGFGELKGVDGNATVSYFQDIPLPNVQAKRIAFKILSNYSREFYKGTSFEGTFANGSYVGLAEVQFFTGTSLDFKDIEEEITNTVIIPAGQDSVTLKITPKKLVGDKQITITILEDYTRYTVDFDSLESTVNVK